MKMAVCNVISHRGSNKIAPQNTLPAFRKSIDFHADGFETDVHLTFDGVPVICHNYTIDETSNGKGLIANPPKNKDYSIVPKTINMVKAHGLFKELLISSFDPIALTICKDVDENCKTGFLYSPNSPNFFRIYGKEVDFAKCIGADALHPYLWLVDKILVDNAHKNGMTVNPWTVNKERDIKRLVELGVDGVITDVPNVAKKIIEEL